MNPDTHSTLLYTPNRSQAEMIVGLLADEGIPAVINPTSGLDLPGAYELGGCEVLVAHQDLERAKQLTEQGEQEAEPEPSKTKKGLLQRIEDFLHDIIILGS